MVMYFSNNKYIEWVMDLEQYWALLTFLLGLPGQEIESPAKLALWIIETLSSLNHDEVIPMEVEIVVLL